MRGYVSPIQLHLQVSSDVLQELFSVRILMLRKILEKPEHKRLFVFTGIIHLITDVFSVLFSNLYHFETVNKKLSIFVSRKTK